MRVEPFKPKNRSTTSSLTVASKLIETIMPNRKQYSECGIGGPNVRRPTFADKRFVPKERSALDFFGGRKK
jgi:hypothetical protein